MGCVEKASEALHSKFSLLLVQGRGVGAHLPGVCHACLNTGLTFKLGYLHQPFSCPNQGDGE